MTGVMAQVASYFWQKKVKNVLTTYVQVLREHGPFDLVFGGLPCNDFENDGTLRTHKAGMHFQKFAELLQSCKRQHKKVMSFLTVY